MPDSQTPGPDALEQLQDPADAQAAVGADVPQVALEASEADAVEQQTSLRDEDRTQAPRDASWDADEGDLAESSREVGYDDEDYR
ncbi:MAG TPA: hypothetical protein VFJ17_00120 [Mycobacteriales bacterium]|jgi:hypothetical protein|nr:hypothetical protein [Mycobacteriales bacterium]